MRTRFVLLITLLASGTLAAAVALSAESWPAGVATVEAAIDTTGEWNFTISRGGGTDACSGQLSASFTSAKVTVPCLENGTYRGDFVKDDGTFDVRLAHPRHTHIIMGTVSPDGDSASGSWFTFLLGLPGPLLESGTFTAERKQPVTPTVPPPVGGIAIDPELGPLVLETPASSSNSMSLLAGIAAAVAAGVIALGGAAWYARRRVSS